MHISSFSMFPKHLPHAVGFSADRSLGGVVVSYGKLTGFTCWANSEKIGRWENRAAYAEACERAIAKLRKAGISGRKRGVNIK